MLEKKVEKMEVEKMEVDEKVEIMEFDNTLA